MKHIDLFSGIGGFALAAQKVWGNDYENVFFCDNDIFCQKVIKKNFGKESLIYGDIKEVTRKRVIADTRSRKYRGVSIGTGEEILEIRKCDLLTGGFPCQPFSVAGKQRGKEDDRYLWPEMFRIIKEFRPTWVIGENVTGIIKLAFDTVCSDLETEGYEIQPFIIPACAINAPHRRNRVWIIGYNDKYGNEGKEQKIQDGKQGSSSTGINHHASLSPPERLPFAQSGVQEGQWQIESPDWDQNWIEVATRLCGVDDGLPAEVDGLKLTKAGHRVKRLKALGNAIVPQVAMEIFKGIKEVMTCKQ